MKHLVLWITLGLAVAAWPLVAWATQHHEPELHQGAPHAAPTHPAAAPAAAPHAKKPHDPHAPPAATGEHGGGDHAAPHGGGHHEPGAINWTDFGNSKQPPYLALVINIVVLVGLYWFLGRKPIAEALKTRRANIASKIEEAQKMLKEAEARAEFYQAKLKNLDQERQIAKESLIEAGQGERDRLVREAQENAARIQKDAEFLLSQELKQLRQDLMRETVDMAVAAAEELLKKRVTQADQERIAEEYLSDLVHPKKASTTAEGGAS